MLIIKPAKTLTLFIKFWSKTTPKKCQIPSFPNKSLFDGGKGVFLHSPKTLDVGDKFKRNSYNAPTCDILGSNCIPPKEHGKLHPYIALLFLF